MFRIVIVTAFTTHSLCYHRLTLFLRLGQGLGRVRWWIGSGLCHSPSPHTFLFLSSPQFPPWSRMIVSVSLSRIIKFTHTGFTTQSHYYPRIVHSTAVKIIVSVYFRSSVGCGIVVFVAEHRRSLRKGKQTNKQKNKPRGLN